jgi:hypothetical protein
MSGIHIYVISERARHDCWQTRVVVPSCAESCGFLGFGLGNRTGLWKAMEIFAFLLPRRTAIAELGRREITYG